MENIRKSPVSFFDMLKSIGDNILGRVCASVNNRRYDMNNVLKRDITGECFNDCRDTVREAAVMRQAKIDKMMREAEGNRPGDGGGTGKKSNDPFSNASRIH